MDTFGSISVKERKLILIVAFAAVVWSIASFVSVTVDEYDRQVKIRQAELIRETDDAISFAADCGPDYRPVYRFCLIFLTFRAFLGLLKAKSPRLSAFFNLCSLLIFIRWFYKMQRDAEMNILYMPGTPHLLKIATFYDYPFFLFVLVLFCWQLSILRRLREARSG